MTRYGSGSIRTTTQFITGPNSEVILHGAQMTWFPNGKKEATNIYVHGIQQGYAYRWYPNGKLKSVVHYTNGIRDQKEKVWQLSETALIKN